MSLGSCHGIHADIVAPYLVELTTEEQRERWLPGFVSGEILTAIGMTEPSGGSDLASLKTTAVRDGDDWILNGSRPSSPTGTPPTWWWWLPYRPGGQARTRHLAVRGRGRHGGLQPGTQARQGRPGRVRHRRTRSSNVRVPAANLIGELNQGVHPHDELASAGAALQRDRQHRPGCADPRRDPGVRQGAQGVRPADRLVPVQQVPARRARHEDRGHPRLPRQRGARAPNGSCQRSTRPRSSGGAPTCRTRCSTPASSCTAATAT